MSTKLISHTTVSKDFIDENEIDMNILDLVAYCARVSNPANQLNNESSDKLIRYLIKHQHWSPFEMVNACIQIDTTRDIARQILRHRSFSFSEFSQRYAEVELEPILREARLQDKKNRQNSIEIDDEHIKQWWLDRQRDIWDEAYKLYKIALEYGIAKEVARAVLPEGLTPSTLYLNGTIRSWIHYIELRKGNGTQKEHREIALECAKVISKVFPMIDDYSS